MRGLLAVLEGLSMTVTVGSIAAAGRPGSGAVTESLVLIVRQ